MNPRADLGWRPRSHLVWGGGGRTELLSFYSQQTHIGFCFFPPPQEEQEFKNKRLDFMTQDLMKVKESLSDIPQGVLDFLRELLECARKGFTSWIKTIIKGELEGRKSPDTATEGEHLVLVCPCIQHSVT